MELIVLVGLQGSGKSSFYRKYFSESHAIVSKDLMKNKKNKALKQDKYIRTYFTQGISVVVDNMNLTLQNRQDLLKLAHEFNASTKLYYFPLEVSESLIRNKGINRKEVPPVAIHASARTMKKPSHEEGFDEYFVVNMITPEEFEIYPWERGLNTVPITTCTSP